MTTTFAQSAIERRFAALAEEYPELQGMRLDRDAEGAPFMQRGQTTTTYRVLLADGRTQALRILLRDRELHSARYSVNREYLLRYPTAGLVDFRYLIRNSKSDVGGDGNSVVLMDWVAGTTLGAWVDEQRRLGRGDLLLRAANLWNDLVRGLAARGVVHGDLEPNNVIVQPNGGLLLIDYDCLTTPAHLGQVNVERGTTPFQHPRRNEHTVTIAGLDHFSALMIYVALRALGADPTLRAKYFRTRPKSPLLFDEVDFATPDSPLFRDLSISPDEQVRDLAHYLRELHRGKLEDVPAIDEVLLWCHSLDDLLARRDFDSAAALLGRMGSQEWIDPCNLPLIDSALRRVECCRALAVAVESGDIGAVAKTYVPELLHDYPAAAAAADRARRMIEADHCLRNLQAAVDERRWNDFIALWNVRGRSLGDIPAAESFRKTIDRLAAVGRLESLLDDPASDEVEVSAYWQAVHVHGEPPAVERLHAAWQRRKDRSERFGKIRELIAAAGRAPNFSSDQELRDCWKTAEQLGEKRLNGLAEHYRAAKQRMKSFRRLDELTHAPTLLGEQQIAACSRYLPHDYHPKLPSRIRLAQRRLDAVRVLSAALIEPILERSLAAAGEALISARGEPLVDKSQLKRIALARHRVALIEALSACRQLPADERDRRVLDLWNETLPVDCRDAAEVRPLWNEAQARRSLLSELREAAERMDRPAVERSLSSALLKDYQFSADLDSLLAAFRERLNQARLQRRHALVQAILEHDATRFRAEFDRELVAELCLQVPQHQRIIATWTEREILPREKCGLRCGPTEGIAWLTPRRCRLSWTWPDTTITSTCRVGFSPESPSSRAIPEDFKLVFETTVELDPNRTDSRGFDIEIASEWHGAYVVVWPIVDLGFQIFFGEPLTLGQLRPPDQ